MMRDLTDEQLRRAMILKWGSVDPDVLPAWVAEMDFATAPGPAPVRRRRPATVALEKGRVKLEPGNRYQTGLPGHVRLNLATSRDRLTEIVRRLAASIGG